MTSADLSKEAAIIIGALETEIEMLNKSFKDTGLTELARESIKEYLADVQEVWQKYNDIYEDNVGPTIEALEDHLIKTGQLDRDKVDADRMRRAAVHALKNNPTTES